MFFKIKTYLNGNTKAVGHRPRKISRLTQFILECGAEVEATLNTRRVRNNLYGSMPGTLLNKKLLKRYEEMVKYLYVKPAESAIMGSFAFDDIVMGDEPGRSEPRQMKSKNKKKELTQERVVSSDIRTI